MWHHKCYLGHHTRLDCRAANGYATTTIRVSLQEQARNKEHYKYIMTIPEEIVEELEWKPGDDLQPLVRDHALVVESASTPSRSGRKQKVN